MTLDTLLWLLPAVFMFHDFEEIIMVRPWLQKNTPLLRERFPKLAERVLPQLESLSTSAFALAVAEEFILLTALIISVNFWRFANTFPPF
ncbi:MAG: HXXEE domain-containing protein [Chloroflexi bacterium]|nr:HXXEE domain-containing protein [Chloroflexota bacterium]